VVRLWCRRHRVATLSEMESLRIPVLSLRTDDRIKVGLERYERVTRIDDRQPGVVTVIVASGLTIRYGYRDVAVVSA